MIKIIAALLIYDLCKFLFSILIKIVFKVSPNTKTFLENELKK